MTRLRLALVAALLAGLAPSLARAKKPPEDPLMPAIARSVSDGKAVLVFFQAEWCEPCNELEAQILESPRGAPLLRRVHVVRYEFDSALGQIASQQHAVMSLPTTLVLRVRRAEGASATPLAYREVASPVTW
jgi:thiol-disulfide isomerase/thioredoxin